MVLRWWLVCAWLLSLPWVPGAMVYGQPGKGKGPHQSWNSYRCGRSYGYNQNQNSYGRAGQGPPMVHERLDHIQALVAGALKKQKKKQRHGSSYSSSDSSSSKHAGGKKKKKKAQRKSRKDRSRSYDQKARSRASGSAGMTEEDKRELHELRRQAEMRRIREEVAAEIAEAKKSDVDEDKVPVLSPKSKKIITAEARLLTKDGVVQIVKEDASSWKEVAEQISAQALPDMKNLLRQLRRDDDRPIPRGKADVSREVLAELQKRLD